MWHYSAFRFPSCVACPGLRCSVSLPALRSGVFSLFLLYSLKFSVILSYSPPGLLLFSRFVQVGGMQDNIIIKWDFIGQGAARVAFVRVAAWKNQTAVGLFSSCVFSDRAQVGARVLRPLALVGLLLLSFLVFPFSRVCGRACLQYNNKTRFNVVAFKRKQKKAGRGAFLVS